MGLDVPIICEFIALDALGGITTWRMASQGRSVGEYAGPVRGKGAIPRGQSLFMPWGCFVPD